MQNPAPAMLDDEEAVQELERQRRHSKEVEGNDHFTMVSEEGEPVFGSIAASPQALQISGDSAFGDLEAELQKFSMDLRCSPVRILSRHAANESPNLLAHLGSAATRPRSPTPVKAKARPMPPDHRVRFHNDQNIRPSRPYVPQRGPEEAVEAVQRRSRPFSFEHGDLLSQCENFQGGVHAIAEEGADSSQECGDQVEHESTVVTSHNTSTARLRIRTASC